MGTRSFLETYSQPSEKDVSFNIHSFTFIWHVLICNVHDNFQKCQVDTSDPKWENVTQTKSPGDKSHTKMANAAQNPFVKWNYYVFQSSLISIFVILQMIYVYIFVGFNVTVYDNKIHEL